MSFSRVIMESKLNPRQREAVEHVDGPLLVLAGAGSGKTRIVTYRIAHLIALGVPSSEILAVTFTNKAAEEMRSRVEALCERAVLTSTFHSLCCRILRESVEPLGFTRNFTIFDEDDSEKTLKECLDALGLKEDKNSLRSLRAQISNAKNHLIFPEHITREDPLFFEVYPLYQKKLQSYNALDFDDLLMKTVELFEKHPEIAEVYQNRWQFILIDEYQDTNAAQYALIKLLSKKYGQVFAVGDPDQSIYSWRGANVHNILNFEKDFPGAKIITLDQNYRSSSIILEASNALIRNNVSRYEKNLWSDLGEGEKIGIALCDNDLDEVDFVINRLLMHLRQRVSPSECVIFYRTNFQSRVFEDGLLREGIPYEIIGGLSFYQRKEVKDILSYLRMINGSSDMISFTRTINTPKRGLGESALKKFKAISEELSLPIFDTCLRILEGSTALKLPEKQRESLKSYVETILYLRTKQEEEKSLDTFIQIVMESTGYLDFLKEDPVTYQERRENLLELVSKASEWQQMVAHPTLTAFLEELSLNGKPETEGEATDHIKLMTIHNSKGLEFECVFLVGMEEDLFPHLNAKDSFEEVEEERRLCYVGMTRAKKYLYLSASRFRFLWGSQRLMRPSRFLAEIPEEFLQNLGKIRLNRIGSSDEEEEGDFVLGAKVFHKDFGHGIVRKKYQTSMGLTYDVFFPIDAAERTLVAKFAKLTSSQEDDF